MTENPEKEAPHFLIFGERHRDVESRFLLIDELENLYKQGYRVLTIEEHSDFQKRIDQRDYSFWNGRDDKVGLTELAQQAHALGMEVKLIDISSNLWNSDKMKSIRQSENIDKKNLTNLRNHCMFGKLKRIFLKIFKIQTLPPKIISLVGCGHTGKNHPCGNSVDSLLREEGFSVATIGMAIAPQDNKGTDYQQADFLPSGPFISRSELRSFLSQAVPGYSEIISTPPSPPSPSQSSALALRCIRGGIDALNRLRNR